MAEFVAVLDTHKRTIENDIPRLVEVTDSTVIGLRVNDGPTATAAGVEPMGKMGERSWTMPNGLAFATEAFFKAMYCGEQAIPEGRLYDCHAYFDFVLGFMKDMTRPVGGDPTLLNREKLAIFPPEMKPWVGYVLLRRNERQEETRVHSLIALPRRYLSVPENLSIAGINGPMTISNTRTQPKLYGGQRFYGVKGVASEGASSK